MHRSEASGHMINLIPYGAPYISGSSVWHLEFWGGCYILENLWTLGVNCPLYLSHFNQKYFMLKSFHENSQFKMPQIRSGGSRVVSYGQTDEEL